MKRKSIKLEYDASADAAYLTLIKTKVVESEAVEPGLIVDLDSQDRIVGIEILRFSKRFMRQAKQRKLAS
jgi:uncharacterized protein YuzE